MPIDVAIDESPTSDEQLLQTAEELVLKKINDAEFSVEVMAKKLGFSQRQLARTFGKLTGLTPVQFILELRLQKARQSPIRFRNGGEV